jgi:hypothetical protein
MLVMELELFEEPEDEVIAIKILPLNLIVCFITQKA